MNEQVKKTLIHIGIGIVLGFVIGGAVFLPNVYKSFRTIDNLESRLRESKNRISNAQNYISSVTSRLDQSQSEYNRATEQIVELRAEIAEYESEVAGYRETIDGIQSFLNDSAKGIGESINRVDTIEATIDRIILIIGEIEKRLIEIH